MALHSYRAKLALDIIKEHFGSFVSQVAYVIISRDRVTLTEIFKHLLDKSSTNVAVVDKISPSTITECLLVLGRHNLLIIDMNLFSITNQGEN